ncbi:MAG: hypothetical protein DMD26_04280 [Gemmatimonadetes bacterium]|nr:MAG: hypothetical protein DMD26_04280 [Gemmatimonadota bacterium]
MRFSSEPRVLHSTGVVPLPGAMAVAVSAVRTIDRPAIDVSNMVPKRSVISYALAMSPVIVEPHSSHRDIRSPANVACACTYCVAMTCRAASAP